MVDTSIFQNMKDKPINLGSTAISASPIALPFQFFIFISFIFISFILFVKKQKLNAHIY